MSKREREYDDFEDEYLDEYYREIEGVEDLYRAYKKMIPDRPDIILDGEAYELKDLDTLIDFCRRYAGSKYDIFKLFKLIKPLEELNAMIGMKKLKESVIDLVTYFVSELEEENDEDFLHTILMGPPGTGKTTAANILAKIYCELGYISTSKVVHAKRQDFIAEYVGQSERKTKELIESAFGGVLFIDEAYSIGGGKKADVFSKAIVDILNQYLSEHKKEFICILAGYEKELQDNLFSMNPGLERRFPWRFETSKYTEKEMEEIFKLKVGQAGWICKDEDVEGIFGEKDVFPMAGGSIENLLTCCKFVHARRIFCNEGEKKLLTKEDIEKGLKRYKESLEKKKEEVKHLHMYL